MESLPIADGALDGWISLNTVYFVQDLRPAFAELRRVLAPSGRGVLGIADPEWMARQAFTKNNFTVRPMTDVVARSPPAASRSSNAPCRALRPSGCWFAVRPDQVQKRDRSGRPGRSLCPTAATHSSRRPAPRGCVLSPCEFSRWRSPPIAVGESASRPCSPNTARWSV